MGFEPTISTVTGWHVSPLHHGAVFKILAGQVQSVNKSMMRLDYMIERD